MRGFIFAIIFAYFAFASAQAQQQQQQNATGQPNTCLTFAFDDTFKTGEQMAGYLEEYGWKATFYISPARLGCLHRDYLNWWDVHRIHKKGHEIGCHGFSHEKSFDLDYNSLKNQFCICRALLHKRFGPVTSIAYPHGQVNQTVKNIARECKFCNGRGVGPVVPELVKPRDIWDFKSYSVRREDTCDSLYFKIEDAILSNPNDANERLKWIILNNHVMCESEGDKCRQRYPFSILRSTYECLVRRVKELVDQNQLCVRNVKEVLHLEPGQTVLPVPRSFEGIDLPSDFVFDPALDPDASSSGASILGASLSVVGLLAVMASVM